MLPVIFNNQLFRDLLNNDFTKDMEKVFRRSECDLMRTDIKETEKGFDIHIDLPGFKKDEINAELKDGYLNVSTSKNDGFFILVISILDFNFFNVSAPSFIKLSPPNFISIKP